MKNKGCKLGKLLLIFALYSVVFLALYSSFFLIVHAFSVSVFFINVLFTLAFSAGVLSYRLYDWLDSKFPEKKEEDK